MRYDALCAAAEVILQVESLAQATSDCVATVGIVKIEPCVMNVIPGKVELGVDIRSIFSSEKDILVNKIKAEIEKIAAKRSIVAEIVTISSEEPVKISDDMIAFLENICLKNSVECLNMPSGAGHDAMNMAKLTEIGMLFIPCKDGVSHHHDEYAKTEDLVKGTEILYEAILKLSAEK